MPVRCDKRKMVTLSVSQTVTDVETASVTISRQETASVTISRQTVTDVEMESVTISRGGQVFFDVFVTLALWTFEAVMTE